MFARKRIHQIYTDRNLKYYISCFRPMYTHTHSNGLGDWGRNRVMDAQKCVDVFARRVALNVYQAHVLSAQLCTVCGRRAAPLRDSGAESEKEVLTKH